LYPDIGISEGKKRRRKDWWNIRTLYYSLEEVNPLQTIKNGQGKDFITHKFYK
jgi:hypothetical protein